MPARPTTAVLRNLLRALARVGVRDACTRSSRLRGLLHRGTPVRLTRKRRQCGTDDSAGRSGPGTRAGLRLVARIGVARVHRRKEGSLFINSHGFR